MKGNEMGYIYTGENGTSLRDILAIYYDQDFDVIEFRCRWEEPHGVICDELFGYCQYINGELKPLDGDSYSLDDKYIEWEAWINDKKQCLTVWEDGRYSEIWE